MGPYITALGDKLNPTKRELERIETLAKMIKDGGGAVTVMPNHTAIQIERWKKVAWQVALL